jgi:crossover junction endodeoxyribonuclease RusA
MTVTIYLPLPPESLKPNARVHWRTKAKATKFYRETARWAAHAPHPAAWKSAEIQAHFRFKQDRRRDRDNLLASLKAAFDGLVDARLLADDSGLTHLPVTFEKSEPVGVTLTIRRTDAV